MKLNILLHFHKKHCSFSDFGKTNLIKIFDFEYQMNFLIILSFHFYTSGNVTYTDLITNSENSEPIGAEQGATVSRCTYLIQF